jgi:integrase
MPKKLLSAATVARLKPDPTKRLEIPDAGAAGLYLVLQPSGAKSWAFRYRFADRPAKLTLGSYTDVDTVDPVLGGRLTLAGARKLAGETLAMVERGQNPARAKPARDQNLVHAVARDFLKRHVDGKGLRTAAAIRRTFDVDVLPHWRGRRIEEITKRDILNLLDFHTDRGVTVQANRTLAVIKRFFSWAVERDILKASPADGVKPPAKETSRARALDDEEIVKFWRACDALGPPFGPLLQFLLATGQRLGEAANMSRAEIAGTDWTIPASRAKNNQAHLVHLSDMAATALRAAPMFNGCDLIFTSNGKTAVSGFSKAKRRIDTLLPIPAWTLHDLRRTAASGMARLGHPVHVVEAVLNHRSGSISGVAAVYNRHSYAREKAAALDDWARHVNLLMNPTDNVVAIGTRRP